MWKNRRVKQIFFSFLWILIFSLPINVSAKEQVIKEQNFISNTDSEAEFEKRTNFEKEIQENGKSYELTGISYEILKTDYLDKKEKIIQSDVIAAGETYTPAETFVENNMIYQLADVRQEQRTIQSSVTQTVMGYDNYNYEVTAAGVPATKPVSAVNQSTGQVQEVICSFSYIENLGTNVIENQIPILFEEYDASFYEWNGNLILKNDAVPALYGYESQILSDINAADGSYITGFSWNGDPYTNTDGVLCRDALASVMQVVPNYRVYYIGSLESPEEKGTVYTCTYETDDSEGRVEYEVKASAQYQQVKTRAVFYVLTGVGILIIAGGITAVIMVLAKQKKERKENGEYKCNKPISDFDH